VVLEHLGELLADREPRAERRARVLEDRRDRGAAQRAQLPRREARELLAAETDRPRLEGRTGGEEPRDRERDRRLPEPDSPTSATVSPASTSNETRSTARVDP
jgi:hypothetical protein